MSTIKTNLGKYGEELVAKKLKTEGFTILAYNYRKQCGEIDLIASNHDVLAFIEVKTRQKIHGDLSEVIIPSKQRKIIITAQSYIAQHNIIDKVCRFDVALIENVNGTPLITYIENAFTQPDGYW